MSVLCWWSLDWYRAWLFAYYYWICGIDAFSLESFYSSRSVLVATSVSVDVSIARSFLFSQLIHTPPCFSFMWIFHRTEFPCSHPICILNLPVFPLKFLSKHWQEFGLCFLQLAPDVLMNENYFRTRCCFFFVWEECPIKSLNNYDNCTVNSAIIWINSSKRKLFKTLVWKYSLWVFIYI